MKNKRTDPIQAMLERYANAVPTRRPPRPPQFQKALPKNVEKNAKRRKKHYPSPVRSVWERTNGHTWTCKQGTYTAYVQLGTGGWYGLITDKSGSVVARMSQPTHRSRKVRREAQSVLLKLASSSATPPLTKFGDKALPMAA